MSLKMIYTSCFGIIIFFAYLFVCLVGWLVVSDVIHFAQNRNVLWQHIQQWLMILFYCEFSFFFCWVASAQTVFNEIQLENRYQQSTNFTFVFCCFVHIWYAYLWAMPCHRQHTKHFFFHIYMDLPAIAYEIQLS